MSPLRSSDWPRAIVRDWRLRQWWKSLKSGLFPVPTLDEHITKHWLCLSSKAEKKQLFKVMLGQESASEKCRKQCFLHDQTARMPRTSGPDRSNTLVYSVTTGSTRCFSAWLSSVTNCLWVLTSYNHHYTFCKEFCPNRNHGLRVQLQINACSQLLAIVCHSPLSYVCFLQPAQWECTQLA